MSQYQGPEQQLVHASQLAQTSYLRPDEPQNRRIRRFWRRKKRKVEETPLDAKQAARAERQRNLMNTGDADPND